jgi:hypothetical protein
MPWHVATLNEDLARLILPVDLQGKLLKIFGCNWCERGELNPYGFLHWILSPARLPFRHSRTFFLNYYTNFFSISNSAICIELRAAPLRI